MLLSSISLALTRLGQRLGRWSPLALWPDGIDSPGMWISPRDLTSQWQDSRGTTPVATPGTVADSANPVGLAYDLRAGTPALGPELVTNGDFSAGMAGWTLAGYTTAGTPSGGSVRLSGIAPGTNFNPFAYQIVAVTAGKTYVVTFPSSIAAGIVGIGLYAAGYSGGNIGAITGTETVHVVATSTTLSLTVYAWNGASTDVPFDVTVGPATVKEVPGLHMLQSTSPARPLLSARVNLLTYTEDFGNGVWADYEVTSTENATVAPDGTTTACKVTETSGTWQHVFQRASNNIPMSAGAPVTTSWYMKDDGSRYALVTLSSASWYASATFDLVDGVFVRSNSIVTNTYISGSAEITALGSGWYRVSASFMPPNTESGYVGVKLNRPNIDSQDPSYAGDGISGINIWHPQMEYGNTATAYQSVVSASSYSSTGFPIAQLYDGVDDGMATAAFAAGTLISGMDCMIPVRRDSAAACIAGLYNGIADATKFFGMAESASGSGCVGSGAGTPTVWVDNTQLTGGTAVTRGTLHTALTVGDWHILEFRNLDLSTWTASGFGLYTSYVFPGPRGDILLYPSTASTEDKDAARQWLADYYGVTLP